MAYLSASITVAIKICLPIFERLGMDWNCGFRGFGYAFRLAFGFDFECGLLFWLFVFIISFSPFLFILLLLWLLIWFWVLVVLGFVAFRYLGVVLGTDFGFPDFRGIFVAARG